MQDLVTLQRPPSAVRRSESLTRIHAPLDRSMILLQIVIQIWTSSTAAAPTQILLVLQLGYHLRVRGISVDMDDARPATSRNLQSVLEKALRGSRIAFRRKPEVDRRSGGIHGAIQVAPLARHPDIRLVHPPGTVGRLEFAAAPVVEFRRVPLDPPPNARVVHPQAALDHKL